MTSKLEVIDEPFIIISLPREAVLPETMGVLKHHKEYTDNTDLWEDLYNPHTAYESFQNMDQDIKDQFTGAEEQLTQIKKAADDLQASYVRFINIG